MLYLRGWWPPWHNDGHTQSLRNDYPAMCIKGFVLVGLATERPGVTMLFIFPLSSGPLGFYGPGTYSSCCHLSLCKCTAVHTHKYTNPFVKQAAFISFLLFIYIQYILSILVFFPLHTCIVIIPGEPPILIVDIYLFPSQSLSFSKYSSLFSHSYNLHH